MARVNELKARMKEVRIMPKEIETGSLLVCDIWGRRERSVHTHVFYFAG
jgi:hypothetical protein